MHASQACAQCYAQDDNRRAIIITALDAEAILRAGALLIRCSPPTRLSKVPAMPVFANLDRIPLLQVAVQDDRIDLTLHAMHAKTSCLTWHDRRRAASRHRTAAPRQAGSWRRPATQTFPGLRAESGCSGRLLGSASTSHLPGTRSTKADKRTTGGGAPSRG